MNSGLLQKKSAIVVQGFVVQGFDRDYDGVIDDVEILEMK